MIAVLDSNAVIGLAKGECLELVRALFQQVLAVAVEVSAILVTDDAVLRREAERLGILALGTVETLLLLKRRRVLPAVKPVLDLMQARAYHIESTLYAQALQLAGETA